MRKHGVRNKKTLSRTGAAAGAMADAIVFCRMEEAAASLDSGKTLLLTDKKVYSLFGEAFSAFPFFLLPEGEEAKAWDVLPGIFRRCAELGADRSWAVLALGGGSVSDIAGLAAHLWMRGIRLFTVPTTLLAMADAALGGKNGIDFMAYKNLIGSFHQPERLFCDTKALSTLSGSQFAAGMAEIIKHAIIDGEDYFFFLESALSAGQAAASPRGGGRGEGKGGAAGSSFDYRLCPETLLHRMVAESQRVKLGIVERDPKEKNERRLLNLGHTFGHALELSAGLSHGEAVSLGIVLALDFSLSRGLIRPSAAERVKKLLSGYGLPVDLAAAREAARSRATALSPAAGKARPRAKSFGESVSEALAMDKKREDAGLRLVVPRDIGSVTIEEVALREIQAFLREVLL